MENCNSCYPICPNNACQSKIVTLPCDPNSKDEWFKHKLPQELDPVLSNIYNGCWMCNYEPSQTQNNKLCSRNYLDYGGYQPYNIGFQVDVESVLKNINSCIKKD